MVMPNTVARDAEAEAYRAAVAEYYNRVGRYVAEHVTGRAVERAVHAFLVDTERVPADFDAKRGLAETEFGPVEQLELVDYLFRHWRDESGSLRERFLRDEGAKLGAVERTLAHAAPPSLWQVVQAEAEAVTVENLFDARRARLVLDRREAGMGRPYALLFGQFAEVEEGLRPTGLVLVVPAGDRGWLLAAIRRSFAEAEAAGVVSGWADFMDAYEGAIRGAIRVLNGLRPAHTTPSYVPALGRPDLLRRMAKRRGMAGRLPEGFRPPAAGVTFGGPRPEPDRTEITHRYFLHDPEAWVRNFAASSSLQAFRSDREIGWWYVGEGSPFKATVRETDTFFSHPIWAEIRFEAPNLLAVRAFSGRALKRAESLLKGMAPPGQALPKALVEVQPAGARLPVFDPDPEVRGFVVRPADPSVSLRDEEIRALDEAWLTEYIWSAPYRWAGGKSIAELAAAGETEAVQDFLRQTLFLSAGTGLYERIVRSLEERLRGGGSGPQSSRSLLADKAGEGFTRPER